MAVTVSLYNNVIDHFLSGSITLANLKVMLRNDSTTFDATDNIVGDLNGAEVSGSGWDVGGEALANAAWTVVNTDEAKLDGDDIVVAASGGDIEASRAVIYDDSATDRLIAFLDFGETITATDGNNFTVTFNASGIFVVRLAD